MSEFDELAAAAREARTTGPQFAHRVTSPGGGSMPVIVAVIVAALIIAGAIVFWTLRTAPSSAPAPSTTDVRAPQANAPSAEEQARQALLAEVKAQVNAFDAFAHRLPDVLARRRKAALDKSGAKHAPPTTYDCTLQLSRVGTHNAPDGRPIRFLAFFAGTIREQSESGVSTDQIEITAAFVPGPGPSWTIDSASETTVGHQSTSDSADPPVELNKRRDIADEPWFKDAVHNAAGVGTP